MLNWCRSRYPGAARYWDKSVEIDLIAPDPEDPSCLLVGEVKWKRLTNTELKGVRRDLEQKWHLCRLFERHPAPRFAVLDAKEIISKDG